MPELETYVNSALCLLQALSNTHLPTDGLCIISDGLAKSKM